MANPGRTLNSILNLIDRDVRRIRQRNTKKGPRVPLAMEETSKLVRYANALGIIVHQQERELAKAKREASKLSTDELIKQYKGE